MEHLTELELVLHAYGDGDEPAATAAHLERCAVCREQVERIRRVLAVVDRMEVPDRDEQYGSRVWARIHPDLAPRTTGWFPHLAYVFRPGRLAVAAAAALIIVAAFLAGRFWPVGHEQQRAQANPQQVRERVLLVAVGDHLERSQIALVELLNTEPTRTVDISDEQRWARELVSSNRLYRQTAARAGETAVVSLLDDLERVLVEIGNSPPTLSAPEFEAIRQRIESDGLLFKVRVAGERVRARERAAVRGAAPAAGL